MVRALLDGSKTQTRRVVKYPAIQDSPTDWNWQKYFQDDAGLATNPRAVFNHTDGGGVGIACPYGQPGDRLWVRETWRGVVCITPPLEPRQFGVARYVPDEEHCERVEFQATQRADTEPYRPSIHMPRWASRLLLEITAVRCQRLQDISEADAVAEGYPRCRTTPQYWYQHLWGEINGPDSWAANPWVWVVEFKVIASE